MDKRILVVFNTCGISGNEQVANYVKSINSIFEQSYTNFKLVLSSCLNTPATLQKLHEQFGNKLSYVVVNEVHPVNVTFNFAIQKMVEQFGEFDGYVYVDSGIYFNDKDALKKMVELHFSGPYGMTATRVDTDSGFFDWFGVGNHPRDESGQSELFKNGHIVVPIGRSLNMHVILFDNIIFKTYGKVLPDIFAAYCTESIFSYVNASVSKKFIIHGDIVLNHIVSMDGASSGFSPVAYRAKTSKPPWTYLYRSPKTAEEIIADPVVLASGMGYEEVEPWRVLVHKPEMFDENGYSKNPELLQKALRENFYLNDAALNYKDIFHVFAP
jgi:hypothetical protein